MIGNNVLFTGRLACHWGTYKGELGVRSDSLRNTVNSSVET